MNTAYFFRKAIDLTELKLHTEVVNKDKDQGTPFKIFKIVDLDKKDYEDFTKSLLADRDFIKENTANSIIDFEGNWHCILVREKGQENGILVHSSGYSYARYTAIYK